MIHVEGLTKAFFSSGGKTPIFENISFNVERGDCLVLLGQSGVGKTVLLKTLAGLLPTDSGSVRMKTSNLGMLFQKNALFDSLTVAENLDFPLREKTKHSHIERKRRIEMFLDWVGLAGTECQFPDELSGGMQKRLGIARALIVEPEIIFYDEPTAGLDPVTSRKIADLILRLKTEMGSTLLVVTSDVQRAFQLGSQIGLLVGHRSKGASIAMAGSPETARRSADPRIRQFLDGLTRGPLTDEAVERPNFEKFEEEDVDFF